MCWFVWYSNIEHHVKLTNCFLIGRKRGGVAANPRSVKKTSTSTPRSLMDLSNDTSFVTDDIPFRGEDDDRVYSTEHASLPSCVQSAPHWNYNGKNALAEENCRREERKVAEAKALNDFLEQRLRAAEEKVAAAERLRAAEAKIAEEKIAAAERLRAAEAKTAAAELLRAIAEMEKTMADRVHLAKKEGIQEAEGQQAKQTQRFEEGITKMTKFYAPKLQKQAAKTALESEKVRKLEEIIARKDREEEMAASNAKHAQRIAELEERNSSNNLMERLFSHVINTKKD
jgi:hypothetical protein